MTARDVYTELGELRAKERATRTELNAALAVIATLSTQLTEERRRFMAQFGDGQPETMREFVARAFGGLPLSEAVDLNLKTGDRFDGRSEEGAIELVEVRDSGNLAFRAGGSPEHVVGVDDSGAEGVGDGRGCGHDGHLSSGDCDATATQASVLGGAA